MAMKAIPPPTQVFKALSDPVRWSIVQQIAAAGELACATLEDTVPVSKPTISYHTKVLHRAGLIDVRKSGRRYYYSLRRDVLDKLLGDLRELAPSPRTVPGPVRKRRARSMDSAAEAAILTW
jgi:ArsR family transcriptional regulator, arsenate/arsenite/antimonite-responsive transcriptional repressor